MGSPEAIQPPTTLPTRPSSKPTTVARALLRTAAAISGVVGGVAVQDGWLRAPGADDAGGDPPANDEREEGVGHAEDRGDQADVAEGHGARRRELVGADRVPDEADDEADGQRAQRADPHGAPDRPGMPAGLEFSIHGRHSPGRRTLGTVPTLVSALRVPTNYTAGAGSTGPEETMTAFQKPVTTEAELRELIGEPSVLALAKQLGTLDV